MRYFLRWRWPQIRALVLTGGWVLPIVLRLSQRELVRATEKARRPNRVTGLQSRKTAPSKMAQAALSRVSPTRSPDGLLKARRRAPGHPLRSSPVPVAGFCTRTTGLCVNLGSNALSGDIGCGGSPGGRAISPAPAPVSRRGLPSDGCFGCDSPFY